MYATITMVDFKTFPSPQEETLYCLAINLPPPHYPPLYQQAAINLLSDKNRYHTCS